MLRKEYSKDFNKLLIKLLIVVSVITGLWVTPIFKGKIQPFELVFLFAFPIFLWNAIKEGKLNSIRLNPLDRVMIVYILYVLLNTIFFHFHFIPILETTACIYTACIYLYFSRNKYLNELNEEKFSSIFKFALIVNGVNCLGGGLHYFLTGDESYVDLYKGFPYLGDIVRFYGASSNPYTVVSIFAVYTFIFLAFSDNKKVNNLVITLALLVSFTTITKETAYFILIIITYYAINNKMNTFDAIGKSKSFKYLSSFFAFCFGIFVLSTLFVICSDPCSPNSMSLADPIPINGTISYRYTGYYYLFIGCVELITANPFTGVGLGMAESSIENLNIAPSYISIFEPHDLYWGMLAQLGIPFILIVIYAIYNLGKMLVVISLKNSKITISFYLIIVFIAFDCIGDMGSLHFRHYFVFWGIFSMVYNRMTTTLPNN
jgi:hypothetical protein